MNQGNPINKNGRKGIRYITNTFLEIYGDNNLCDSSCPPEHPVNRGNWILDLEFNNGHIICLKYPKDITEIRFKEFIKPLLDLATI